MTGVDMLPTTSHLMYINLQGARKGIVIAAGPTALAACATNLASPDGPC